MKVEDTHGLSHQNIKRHNLVLDFFIFIHRILTVMKKVKSKSCKSRKIIPVVSVQSRPVYKTIVPVLVEPTIHDLQDELSRLDSFAYSRYNR